MSIEHRQAAPILFAIQQEKKSPCLSPMILARRINYVRGKIDLFNRLRSQKNSMKRQSTTVHGRTLNPKQ